MTETNYLSTFVATNPEYLTQAESPRAPFTKAQKQARKEARREGKVHVQRREKAKALREIQRTDGFRSFVTTATPTLGSFNQGFVAEATEVFTPRTLTTQVTTGIGKEVSEEIIRNPKLRQASQLRGFFDRKFFASLFGKAGLYGAAAGIVIGVAANYLSPNSIANA